MTCSSNSQEFIIILKIVKRQNGKSVCEFRDRQIEIAIPKTFLLFMWTLPLKNKSLVFPRSGATLLSKQNMQSQVINS